MVGVMPAYSCLAGEFLPVHRQTVVTEQRLLSMTISASIFVVARQRYLAIHALHTISAPIMHEAILRPARRGDILNAHLE